MVLEKALDHSHTANVIKKDWEWASVHQLKIMGKSELLDVLERRECPVVWAMICQALMT